MFQKSININNFSKSKKLLFAFIFISFFIFINYMMKNQAYDLSFKKVISHDQVALYLGVPIEAGFFVTGEAGSSETEINYSISGPLNSGNVYVYAQVINGHWVIQNLEVTVESINKKIDVLDM